MVRKRGGAAPVRSLPSTNEDSNQHQRPERDDERKEGRCRNEQKSGKAIRRDDRRPDQRADGKRKRDDLPEPHPSPGTRCRTPVTQTGNGLLDRKAGRSVSRADRTLAGADIQNRQVPAAACTGKCLAHSLNRNAGRIDAEGAGWHIVLSSDHIDTFVVPKRRRIRHGGDMAFVKQEPLQRDTKRCRTRDVGLDVDGMQPREMKKPIAAEPPAWIGEFDAMMGCGEWRRRSSCR